jgi:hypothetical protein
MAKMRFDPSTDGIDDAPWTKLATIAECLDLGEPVPSHLSSWFSGAVKYANGDGNELLHRLGLTLRRGESADDWSAELIYKMGQAVCFHEDNGMKPNKAMKAVLDAYSEQNQADAPSPSTTTLRRWRDEYRQALAEAVKP